METPRHACLALYGCMPEPRMHARTNTCAFIRGEWKLCVIIRTEILPLQSCSLSHFLSRASLWSISIWRSLASSVRLLACRSLHRACAARKRGYVAARLVKANAIIFPAIGRERTKRSPPSVIYPSPFSHLAITVWPFSHPICFFLEGVRQTLRRCRRKYCRIFIECAPLQARVFCAPPRKTESGSDVSGTEVQHYHQLDRYKALMPFLSTARRAARAIRAPPHTVNTTRVHPPFRWDIGSAVFDHPCQPVLSVVCSPSTTNIQQPRCSHCTCVEYPSHPLAISPQRSPFPRYPLPGFPGRFLWFEPWFNR